LACTPHSPAMRALTWAYVRAGVGL
jgi:hypothetical protein